MSSSRVKSPCASSFGKTVHEYHGPTKWFYSLLHSMPSSQIQSQGSPSSLLANVDLWFRHYFKQESIPVGCVRPALHHTGDLCPGVTVRETPLDRDQPEQRPRLDRDQPQKEHGARHRDPWKEHGTRQLNRKWHHTETPQTPVKNITLPQTSFADGKIRMQSN